MRSLTSAGGRGWLRVMGVLALTGGMCAAQVGPPACPVGTGAGAEKAAEKKAAEKKAMGSKAAETATSMRVPVARPTIASTRATAEAGAADPTVMMAAEPMENFGVARYRLENYAECVGGEGCYWADMEAQARRAEGALDRAVAARRGGERLAMVLDIDDTSLSTYCVMKEEKFGFIETMFSAWMNSPEDSVVLPGTLRLFNKARAAGVEVFFITGRMEPFRAATVRGLETAGYKGWKGLSLRRGAQQTMATVAYKSEERRKIVDAGYRIVMSVGDQWSDLNGEPRAEISVKMPNPFYYLP